MRIGVEHFGRADASPALQILADWTAPGCYVRGLHPGDIGWHLRLDDELVDESLVLVRREAEPAALVLVDSPDAARVALAPHHRLDLEVASAVADVLEAAGPTDSDVYADVETGSALRAELSARGWAVDPDSWVALYRPLSAADGRWEDPLTHELVDATDVEDRVAVQRSAFIGSTFTPDRWRQMSTGPGFDSGLDLLRRDREGTPVAAATGWLAGAGRCGILEPVGAAPGSARKGHGSAVSAAAIAALARRGASGVTVITPCANTAAVATYERCGLRQVEILHAMMRTAVGPKFVADSDEIL